MCCQVMVDSLTATVQQRVAKLGLLVCFAPSDLNSNRRAISLQDCLLVVQNRKVSPSPIHEHAVLRARPLLMF